MDRYPSEFRSGFTRWIEQRMAHEDAEDLIEVFGVLARTGGLTEENGPSGRFANCRRVSAEPNECFPVESLSINW